MFNSSPLGDFVFYINIGTDMRRAIIEFSSPNGAFIFISEKNGVLITSTTFRFRPQ